ncbi:hypothetical protein E3N88_33988 [Mikania micrantha]|uniref:SWIM-type domain-containing protein n=1 Tax=Mikania micrantha TaxID=192012 RepID=A0A5N6MD90_9ASTR|nr:hypothetical protein E3N88_33988 [Mikania micrantha]
MFSPILVQLYWGGNVSYQNGSISYDASTRSTTVVIREKSSYEEFIDLIYKHLQIEKEFYQLKLKLYYTFQGFSQSSEIFNDSSLEVLYYLATTFGNFHADVYVSIEPTMSASVQQTSCMDLLRGFNVTEAQQQQMYSYECNTSQFQFDGDLATTVDVNVESESEECLESTEESEDYPSNNESTDGDNSMEEHVIPEQYHTTTFANCSQGSLDHSIDPQELREYEAADFDDDDEMDIWNKESREVRIGMYFRSKDELMHGVRLWNLDRNRELIVDESKRNKWRAKCYTTNPKCNPNIRIGPPCKWYVSASKKSNDHMWRIVRWVEGHNCYGTVVRNNNRCLKSRDIATLIIHAIREDIAYPVKQIQAHLKDQLNVDISYSKAWRGRREAIERIHGSWVSNFREIPKYVEALKAANPGTVVEWQHHSTGSSNSYTFKYVFWAFRPAIKAFQYCQPVLSVDGTHLKGSYRGKMLIAVTKNANNYIVPIAYAIVDEETVESWTWFFHQFWLHIAMQRGKKLCVISDRHKGIINAMQNMQVWKENAAHRFCLRHVRSNLIQKFKVSSMKRLCWDIGSTTQQRKYEHSVQLLSSLNPQAWEYLKGIKESKWTLLNDKNHRRWGNLTTNISESFNNTLRGVRLMPIKAIIDCTFNKAVEHFRRNTDIIENCDTLLPPRIWRLFNTRDLRSQEHMVTEFDYRRGRYRVVSKIQRNESGGNDYTIEYLNGTCSCGKWQIQRFPCSHALAVCRQRGDSPQSIINELYTMAAYRAQYDSEFFPLSHQAYWMDPIPYWRIKPDSSKLTTARGRRQSRRIHNEMDVRRHPDEPVTRRCGICRQIGHRQNNCPNSHH